ncbi:hypothetical protein J3Q64DRAFT_1739735 [Phycomyces blakesleeanus]|uniref:Uncharacterized protein n=1 Tax=Phycomyces blakesleeanus TaxID=4837 RepID=A0ABR3B2L5_PHYBL
MRDVFSFYVLLFTLLLPITFEKKGYFIGLKKLANRSMHFINTLDNNNNNKRRFNIFDGYKKNLFLLFVTFLYISPVKKPLLLLF